MADTPGRTLVELPPPEEEPPPAPEEPEPKRRFRFNPFATGVTSDAGGPSIGVGIRQPRHAVL